MSQSQPSTPTGQQDTAPWELPSNPFAGRRQQTTADFRPPRLEHQGSSAALSIGRYATTHVRNTNSTRPGPDRNLTAPSRLRRNGTTRTNRTGHSASLVNTNDRAEKKQEQTVDVENDYFALNPWYNQQKDKPVFGLAAPLPRTVRRGMWWGRSGVRRALDDVNEGNDEDGIDRNDGLDFSKDPELENDSEETQVPEEHDEYTLSRHGSDYFQTKFRGHHDGSSRPSHKPTGRAQDDHGHEDRHDLRERAPVNEHGLTYNNDNDAPTRNHFGLADGLPPLQELESNDTTQTKKEKNEIQQREHEAQQEFYNQYRNPIARLRAQYPQAPAEFLATFVYLFLGICVNLSVATSKSATGSFETQAWGWGFAVMIGIYLGGGVSGAHLSPTISLSLMLYRGFPWRMTIVYICVQMLAGLCAGALAFGLYRDAIYAVDPGLTLEITGSALFPKGPSFTTAGGFFNDFVYMAIYVCIAFALGDDQNSPPGQGMTALIFGFTGFVTMVALGYNTGLGISPARDLGPRLIGLWAGYDEAFKGGYWAYGPWGASISGALFGGLIYDLFIFVGGESPVNYRWPEPGDIKWKVKETTKQAKDQIHRMA
ncbi:aquaporin-like protein [Paraphoma chrysanthemicola]|uniref:Aquaporin-like protein n=1 Tax=Paraphoma chrysanthemicola TaxID=798071 RepID=A0A8K0W547_9PLEO|nr:aquaporin-like protein [Paraphoma chrysanthemicola]